MINFDPIGQSKADPVYLDFVYALVRQLEGFEAQVYADSVGIPTIGVGFNITDPTILGAVMDGMDLIQAGDTVYRTNITNHIANFTSVSQLQTDLDAEMAARETIL